MKVVKFGGSSLSTSEQIKKVYNIVVSDPERKAVVVSAPGKRFEEDVKVTDLLIECGERTLNNREYDEIAAAVILRYQQIAEELQLPSSVGEEISQNILGLLKGKRNNPRKYLDRIKASGEDNHARLIAAYFQSQGQNASYMNPRTAGLIVSNEPGNAQVLPQSYERLSKLREHEGIIIFPGFFGYNTEGEVMTFSRSGSDITGAILANGMGADIYENFTDVDAVYAVNPSIITHPKEIRELTYREMRELSYAGFSVFHDEALVPAFRAAIPVHIRNTNNPEAEGTLVVSSRDNKNGPVTGIASDNGFCRIYISKYLMNREIGFGRKLLQILEKHGVSYEHIPSGIDDVTLILRQEQIGRNEEDMIISEIKKELRADEVVIERDLALVMIVGEGMRQNVGTAARASQALADASVNIEMINQGSSEVSMMFGVHENDEKKAVGALYRAFF
ncbi:aspartate kinase [Bacillus sp. OV322]|uniref:aspartate kinase n=1 Tax=Bacillus sp. OV322 TaxID=1882764 RepID=UPI0008EE096F|nr:aspartate kinase [Bacillus sp. OV322]SFC87964.1 aspartate kinase [Bacillus sp. OV322]